MATHLKSIGTSQFQLAIFKELAASSATPRDTFPNGQGGGLEKASTSTIVQGIHGLSYLTSEVL